MYFFIGKVVVPCNWDLFGNNKNFINLKSNYESKLDLFYTGKYFSKSSCSNCLGLYCNIVIRLVFYWAHSSIIAWNLLIQLFVEN